MSLLPSSPLRVRNIVTNTAGPLRSIRPPVSIGRVIGVSLRAVSSVSLPKVATLDVLTVTNSLDMRWVHTGTDSTEVVGLRSSGENSNQSLVSNLVSQGHLTMPPESSVAFGMERCLPNPTTRWRNLDLRPESLGESSVTELDSGRLMMHRKLFLSVPCGRASSALRPLLLYHAVS